MADIEKLPQGFLRTKKLPHIWCPGCGNGIITAALVRAIYRIGYNQRDVVIVSGIGCSSRAAGYLNFNTLHTTHGRALAFATGLKMARPELKIFVIMGDGDCSAIGGNHFIHTARRNIDLNAVVINNHIFGMTGGQHSPLTPIGKKASTAPRGTVERAFDLLELARGAGATFGARGTAAHPRQLEQLFVRGANHKGFSVVEVFSTCPIAYGRRNKLGGAVEMLRNLRDNSIPVERASPADQSVLVDKYITGVLYSSDVPEFTEQYYRSIGKN
ncbi:MAG TPA: 2-oxoacid:ferredoxin oxidoreductase subunit beta [Candidatus Limnocylindrales bacterium]|nr:2-oxoacid:ferredoxin oxidoreductase subunit beta [Candidatus Limnocylindrales bacterium]